MNKRSFKTRRAIRIAFVGLLAEKNLNDITVSELASRADLDRRTFYLHYATINDISDEIMKEALFEIKEEYRKSKTKNLMGFLHVMNEIGLGKYRPFFRAILMNPSCFYIVRNCTELMKEELLNQLLSSSSLSREKLVCYADYISFGIMGMYVRWYRSNSEEAVDVFTAMLHEVISNSWNLIQSSFTNYN